MGWKESDMTKHLNRNELSALYKRYTQSDKEKVKNKEIAKDIPGKCKQRCRVNYLVLDKVSFK